MSQLDVGQRTRKRIAARLLPFIFLIFLINSIASSSIGFAISGLRHDLGFSDVVYGLGAGFWVIGYLVLGAPGAIILERWSARKWIACILVASGVLTIVSGFIRSAGEFYIMRFALGLAEASLFPGLLSYLTHWFRSQDRARAISSIYVGILLAPVIGAPVGHLLLQQSWLGVPGWRWLFVVEGVPAALLGIVTIFYLTDWPIQASWLSSSERDWLTAESEAENQAKATADFTIWEGLSDKRIWLLALAWCCTVASGETSTFWLPGFVRRHSALSNSFETTLLAVVAFASVSGMVLNSWHSDRTQERTRHAFIPLALCGLLYLQVIASQQNFGPTIAFFLLFGFLMRAAYPVFWSLPNVILSGSSAAAAFGLISSIGQLGGVAAPIAMAYLADKTNSPNAGFAFTGFTYLISALLLLAFRIKPPVSTSSMVLQASVAPFPNQNDCRSILSGGQNQPEANLGASCLRTVRKQKAKALWRALAWAVGVNLVLLLLMGGISFPVGLMLGFYVYLKHSQGNAVVLWFRRFHTGMVRRTKFNWLLSRALRGIGASASIQDSSFRYSYWVSPGRMLLSYFAWNALLLACAALSIFAVVPLWIKLNLKSDPGLVILVVLAIMLIAATYMEFRYLRKRAYVRLQEHEWAGSLDKLLSRIVQRKGVRYGTVLIRCEDSFWQQAVCQALAKATAAIIDVSEISENVVWELKTVLANLPPSCIILAFPAEGGTPEVLPDVFRSRLAELMDTEAITSCALFGYPPRFRRFSVRHTTSKIKELQMKLAHAVDTRSFASVSRAQVQPH